MYELCAPTLLEPCPDSVFNVSIVAIDPNPEATNHHHLPPRFTDCSYTLGPGAHVLAWLIRLDYRRRSVVSARPPASRLPCYAFVKFSLPSTSDRFILPFHLFFIFYVRMPASATMLALSRLLSFAARAHLLSHIHRRASARNAVAFTGSTRAGARWVGVARYLLPACLCCYLLLP